MSNINFNILLFEMFWEQNAEKTFDDFVTLEKSDKAYSGIKLKDLKLKNYASDINCVSVRKLNDTVQFLCYFNFDTLLFSDFSSGSNELNIFDHITYKDLV